MQENVPTANRDAPIISADASTFPAFFLLLSTLSLGDWLVARSFRSQPSPGDLIAHSLNCPLTF
jgi:hypothetical protein